MSSVKYEQSPQLLAVAQTLLTVAVAHGGSKNPRLNWAFFFPIAYLCLREIFLCYSGDDAPRFYPSITSAATIFCVASDFILLRPCQPELRQVGQKISTSSMSFRQRLGWAFQLILSPRGVGWTHEAQHLPPRPQISRMGFVAHQLVWAAFYFLVYDACSVAVRANPCFAPGGPSLTSFGWAYRMTVWFYPVQAYTVLSCVFNILSIVSVLTKLSQPRDWPHLFGGAKQAYTVRRVWGRAWHQILRRPLTSHANFVVRTLGLPKGKISTYLRLFLAFFMSGLIHGAGDYNFQQLWTFNAVNFFLLQATVITVEDAVIGVANKAGLYQTTLSKTLGFVWVFVWFTYSFPMWMDPMLHAGTNDGEGISLISGLTKGTWVVHRS